MDATRDGFARERLRGQLLPGVSDVCAGNAGLRILQVLGPQLHRAARAWRHQRPWRRAGRDGGKFPITRMNIYGPESIHPHRITPSSRLSSRTRPLNVVCWIWQTNLPVVDLGEAAVALFLGAHHACAILVTGVGGFRVGRDRDAGQGYGVCHVVCRGLFARDGCDARWSRKRKSGRSVPAW